MILNQQIKKFREEQSLTQDELAHKMNVSRQSISKWEQGVSYPTIDNLVLLSKILYIPLETLILGDLGFPIPYAFGKPKSKLRVIIPLCVPVVLLGVAILTIKDSLMYSLMYILSSIFIFGLFSTVSMFDYKRYYNYFIIEQFGLNVDITSGKSSLVKTMKGLLGLREGRFIAYEQIDSVEIKVDTRGFAGTKGLDYRPRQYAMNRERFIGYLKLKNNDIYELPLESLFYADSNEYQDFYAIFQYFEKEGIKIYDKQAILNSIKQEYDLIEKAYEISRKPR